MKMDKIVEPSMAGFRAGMECGRDNDEITAEDYRAAPYCGAKKDPEKHAAWSFAFRLGLKHRRMLGGLTAEIMTPRDEG